MKRDGLPRWVFLGALTLVVAQLVAPCLCEAMAPAPRHCAMSNARPSPCALHSKTIEHSQSVSAAGAGCCCMTVPGVSLIATVTVPGGVLPAQNAVEAHGVISIVAATATPLPALLPSRSQPISLRI